MAAVITLFQYYYDNLELFDFHCIEWHWHREFEFLYVESGKVLCGIGGKQIILSEGDAIFINSKILHRFYAASGGVIPNFVCMPEFIAPENSLVYKKIYFANHFIEYGFPVFSEC